MAERYIARCQYCGKVGTTRPGMSNGSQPNVAPTIPGKCPCHPSGNPNAPHSPKWERT